MSTDISLTRDIATCHALRRTVFIEEQNVPEAIEVDGLDPVALHLLARVAGAPMGTARILIKGDIAKIGRVCVLAPARGTGLGADMMRKALEVCKAQKGVKKAVLGSQVHAMAFYEKLGFTAFGPVYLDAGIEHRDMEYPL